MNDGEFMNHGQKNVDGIYCHWLIVRAVSLKFTQKSIVKIMIASNPLF